MLKTIVLMAAAASAAFCADAAMAKDRGGVEALTTVRVASGMERPIFATHAPGDFKRLYIIQKRGAIRVLDLQTGDLQSLANAFLNIDPLVGGGTSTNSEQGLLGLAFHPDYQSNGTFFVNYTNNAGDTVVAKYTVTSPDEANASSADIIFTADQPFSNHNGGWIDFGPDGYLYISLGDGGLANDPQENGQDITTILGSMLRIDADNDDFPGDATRDYAIPGDNPFVGVTNAVEEIWAYGLRNAWRPSFDRETGDLWIADVGQNQWEEINVQPASSAGGENYGWDCREGSNPFESTGCTGETFVDPIYEYSHGGSPFRCSITGGYAYRGCDIPSLRGHYFFADYCSNQIWTFTYSQSGGVQNFTDRTSELDPAGSLSISSITSFGEDAKGELYICDQNGGEVFKVVPVTPTISEFDFNCDGIVNSDDLFVLLGAWGSCDGCQADLDGDGSVDSNDLFELLGGWG